MDECLEGAGSRVSEEISTARTVVRRSKCGPSAVPSATLKNQARSDTGQPDSPGKSVLKRVCRGLTAHISMALHAGAKNHN